MTRIVHLSDPHFGAEEPRLLAPLLQSLTRLAPEMIVLSGDLTQRARPAQFAAAAAFIAACPAPVLAIPGNHDTPLHNLYLRLFDPWRRWRAALGDVLEPVYRSDGLLVVGVNTANPLAWKNGSIGQADLVRIERLFAGAGARRRVLVIHHPLQGPPSEAPALAGAAKAMPALAAAGVEVVLSGHLHSTYATALTAAPGVLSVQAGTCLSHRVRGDGNAFTSLHFAPDAVTLTHHRAGADGQFRADADLTVQRGGAGWV